MSCCEEKSVCDVVDKSGNGSGGCNTYADFSVEGKKVNTAETVIAGVAPEKEFVDGLEMRERAENEGCTCNPCKCDPCNC